MASVTAWAFASNLTNSKFHQSIPIQSAKNYTFIRCPMLLCSSEGFCREKVQRGRGAIIRYGPKAVHIEKRVWLTLRDMKHTLIWLRGRCEEEEKRRQYGADEERWTIHTNSSLFLRTFWKKEKMRGGRIFRKGWSYSQVDLELFG